MFSLLCRHFQYYFKRADMIKSGYGLPAYSELLVGSVFILYIITCVVILLAKYLSNFHDCLIGFEVYCTIYFLIVILSLYFFLFLVRTSVVVLVCFFACLLVFMAEQPLLFCLSSVASGNL